MRGIEEEALPSPSPERKRTLLALTPRPDEPCPDRAEKLAPSNRERVAYPAFNHGFSRPYFQKLAALCPDAGATARRYYERFEGPVSGRSQNALDTTIQRTQEAFNSIVSVLVEGGFPESNEYFAPFYPAPPLTFEGSKWFRQDFLVTQDPVVLVPTRAVPQLRNVKGLGRVIAELRRFGSIGVSGLAGVDRRATQRTRRSLGGWFDRLASELPQAPEPAAGERRPTVLTSPQNLAKVVQDGNVLDFSLTALPETTYFLRYFLVYMLDDNASSASRGQCAMQRILSRYGIAQREPREVSELGWTHPDPTDWEVSLEVGLAGDASTGAAGRLGTAETPLRGVYEDYETESREESQEGPAYRNSDEGPAVVDTLKCPHAAASSTPSSYPAASLLRESPEEFRVRFEIGTGGSDAKDGGTRGATHFKGGVVLPALSRGAFVSTAETGFLAHGQGDGTGQIMDDDAAGRRKDLALRLRDAVVKRVYGQAYAIADGDFAGRNAVDVDLTEVDPAGSAKTELVRPGDGFLVYEKFPGQAPTPRVWAEAGEGSDTVHVTLAFTRKSTVPLSS